MGIEGFFSNFKNTRGIIKDFVGKVQIRNFLIDFNSILYTTSAKIEEDIAHILAYLIYQDPNLAELTETFARSFGWSIEGKTIRDFRAFFTEQKVEELIISFTKQYVYNLINTYADPLTLRTIYIAIDGTPNMGKVIEQKHRKYMGHVIGGLAKKIHGLFGERLSPQRKLFEKNKISFSRNLLVTWSGFMGKMAQALRDEAWIRTLGSNLEFIVSGSDYPGEGEKKLMEWVVKNISGDARTDTLLYSPDADVMLLTMILQNISYIKNKQENRFYVLRYDNYQKNYALCDMDELSTSLYSRIYKGQVDLAKRFNITNDFVLLSTFFGNDFLSKIRSVDIISSLPLIFSEYSELVVSHPDFKIIEYTDKFTINYENLLMFLNKFNGTHGEYLSLKQYQTELKENKSIELDYYAKEQYRNDNILLKYNYENLSKLDYELMNLDKKRGDFKVKLGSIMEQVDYPTYTRTYYESYLNGANKSQVSDAYLKGFAWVIDFYWNKNDSDANLSNVSTWFYPYERAPLLSDITQRLSELVVQRQTASLEANILAHLVPRSQFFNRYEQMLYTFPFESIQKNGLILPGYESLISNPDYFPHLNDYVENIWRINPQAGQTPMYIDTRGIRYSNKGILAGIHNLPFNDFFKLVSPYRLHLAGHEFGNINPTTELITTTIIKPVVRPLKASAAAFVLEYKENRSIPELTKPPTKIYKFKSIQEFNASPADAAAGSSRDNVSIQDGGYKKNKLLYLQTGDVYYKYAYKNAKHQRLSFN